MNADSIERINGPNQIDLSKDRYSVLLTGDTSFGESYQERLEAKGRENVLKTRGYAYTIAQMAPMLRSSNLNIVNLETTVTDCITSPFMGIKGYIHRSDIYETPKQLLGHNIKCVCLANNHSTDYGETGLRQTLDVLDRAGIVSFGAGCDLSHARTPFDHEIPCGYGPSTNQPGKIRVFAAFEVNREYQNKFRAYAGPKMPGTNPLVLKELSRAIADTKASNPGCFVIAILHWRRDYKWRSRRQLKVARRLMRSGADLIIGHGAHMMQEIEKVDGRWVAHGLGNFVFNSPGRYEMMKAPPYSLVARLIFDASGDRRLRLYPILTDNRKTNYQSRFVTAIEFDEVYRILMERSSNANAFEQEITPGRDQFGAYLNLPL